MKMLLVGPPTEEKIERRDPHPEKKEGTEYVYLCVSQCKFVIPYLGVNHSQSAFNWSLVPHGSEHSRTIFCAHAFTF